MLASNDLRVKPSKIFFWKSKMVLVSTRLKTHGLDHVLEFKYLRSVLEKSGTDGAECSRKVLNAMVLQLECAIVLYKRLLVPVLTYGRRRRDLELGLYGWITSEICFVLGGWIGSKIYR